MGNSSHLSFCWQSPLKLDFSPPREITTTPAEHFLLLDPKVCFQWTLKRRNHTYQIQRPRMSQILPSSILRIHFYFFLCTLLILCALNLVTETYLSQSVYSTPCTTEYGRLFYSCNVYSSMYLLVSVHFLFYFRLGHHLARILNI